MARERQYCTFFVDGLYFGIQVERVQEIIRFQKMTPVPLAPKIVAGLINLRGQIVTALDIRHRLDLKEAEEGCEMTNVVTISEDGHAVSLLVDEIGDVVEVGDASRELPPPTLRGAARKLIKEVHKLEDRLLLVLDLEMTIDVGEMNIREMAGS